MHITRILTVLLVSFLFSATSLAQVFDSGPSDSALFTNVFNLPGDVLPSNSVGGIETTQINVTSGGVVGDSFEVSFGREVNISGGSVGDNFDAFSGSEVNISGGSVGNQFRSFVTEVNISGGFVGDNFLARGGVVNISGGAVGVSFDANNSLVNISGGSVGDNFEVYNNSNVNLFGSDFVLDGVLLDDLVAGEAFTILDRNVTLSGQLADGSAFSFDLNDSADSPSDYFLPGSTLTVTPVSTLLGDCNLDGVVNFLDIAPFISILSGDDYLAEADVDEDGVVTFFDIGPFIERLSAVEPPSGTVRVQLQPVNGIFTEGFEVGLRFETADGTVIASTLWTDFVLEKNDNPTFEDLYQCVLEQSVPPGDIVVWAEANVGEGPPPVIPDLDGPLPCRLDVSVPEGGQIDVEVLFFDQNCLRLR